ncbi:MAG: 8-oxo-dGTP diphosphatase [Candidatus Andersenbacteria bacterium]|nr:8-oxo-dGTP diphosphatase [Candidatus Andersenbacteria bacterium]
MKKVTTLCTVLLDGKILLGMKKRGFGEGWWNGFGGKLQPGETIEAAAIRECREEAGITPTSISPRAVLNFYFEDSPDELEVHVFLIEAFTGQVQESEEMRPNWFSLNEIPYEKMWADDPYWLPQVLAGKKLAATFWFKDIKTLLRHQVREV